MFFPDDIQRLGATFEVVSRWIRRHWRLARHHQQPRRLASLRLRLISGVSGNLATITCDGPHLPACS
jgi:hypothetical protein